MSNRNRSDSCVVVTLECGKKERFDRCHFRISTNGVLVVRRGNYDRGDRDDQNSVAAWPEGQWKNVVKL